MRTSRNTCICKAGAKLLFLHVTAAMALASGPITYVKTYSNLISGTTQQKDLTPEDVQSTSDGGYILLASTDCTTGPCVSAQGGYNPIVTWLVKTDSSGNAQWQKELGCFTSPPGDYSIGVSVQQTTDGGYVVGGGAIDCGTGTTCGGLFSLTCAIVEKLGSGGNVIWARTYSIGPYGGAVTNIKQTSDGGYVAAGNSYASGSTANGGLILKLDSSGNLQWQRTVGPAGSTTAIFNAVRQTSDGGYVATGSYYAPAQGALVVKLDSSGNVQWQHGFSNGGASGSATATSIVQTSDGGYLAAGYWVSSTNVAGALLLKLDSGGNVQLQNAYNGGTYCFFNGYSETCTSIGAFVDSLHQTSDGGFVLAGDGHVELTDEAPLVPWLAKTDSNGNLLWQRLYYQTSAAGRPLSEYFASSALATDGGFLALGWTEDYTTGLGLLYAVKTDSSGLCGSCSEVHPAPALSVVNPGLTTSALSLPVTTTATPGVSSPATIKTTSIKVKKGC
jgi:hypothetical protein